MITVPLNKNIRRTVLIAMVALAAVVGSAVWYRWATDDSAFTAMKGYPPARQAEAAKGIVAGLNSRDPRNVDLLRNNSVVPKADADNAAITQNIIAAMPPVGCQYSLTNLKDAGSQDVATVPWFKPSNARGFDMKLQQTCPGQAPVPGTIRVIAIPSGMAGTGPKQR